MRERDPIAAWLRTSRAQRRVGPGAECACGEARPYALISERVPPCCFRCERLAHRREPYEWNHVFGKRNRDLMIRYPINDHRAVFSVKQHSWPPGALENPNGSPLLASVAASHGLYDNIEHMLKESRTLHDRLVSIEDQLTAVFGPDWPQKLEDAAKKAAKRGHP